MFGKSTTSPSATDLSVPVNTIPPEFYGGVNPTIQFKTVAKVITTGAPVLSAADKKSLDKATAAGSGQPLHPARLFANRRFLIISGIVLFITFTASASWYYWRQTIVTNLPPAPPIVPVASEQILPPEPATATPQEITPEIIPSSTITPTIATVPAAPSLLGGALDIPSMLLGNSADLDKDGLTDAEEELFKTDPGVPDTDTDKYSDSSEVYHLYSPLAADPAKLIDSGLVQEYANSVFGYKLYYPATWAVGAVDQSSRDVLFSTITGENIEVRVFDNDQSQTFADWLAIYAPGENAADITDFTTAFKDSGKKRSDYLAYYFNDRRYRYVLLYHPIDQTVATINYRDVIKLAARSFRFFDGGSILPNQEGSAPQAVFDIATTTASSTNTIRPL